MNIREYKIIFSEQLSHLYDKEEVDSFFYLLLKDFKNISRVDLALQPDLEFSAIEYQKIDFYLKELKAQKPIQYVLGATDFFGLQFKVNPNVDRKSTRLNSSHVRISYAVFCLKKKKKKNI